MLDFRVPLDHVIGFVNKMTEFCGLQQQQCNAIMEFVIQRASELKAE